MRFHMELAQALVGAGDSFLRTNEPEFSNIRVQTAVFFCANMLYPCKEVRWAFALRHFLWHSCLIRGVHDLNFCATDKYGCLINFMYLDTNEEVDKFSGRVQSLGTSYLHSVIPFFLLIDPSYCDLDIETRSSLFLAPYLNLPRKPLPTFSDSCGRRGYCRACCTYGYLALTVWPQ